MTSLSLSDTTVDKERLLPDNVGRDEKNQENNTSTGITADDECHAEHKSERSISSDSEHIPEELELEERHDDKAKMMDEETENCGKDLKDNRTIVINPDNEYDSENEPECCSSSGEFFARLKYIICF